MKLTFEFTDNDVDNVVKSFEQLDGVKVLDKEGLMRYVVESALDRREFIVEDLMEEFEVVCEDCPEFKVLFELT